MEAGNKVLFVDGDITSDVFLGKYKLGKMPEVLWIILRIQMRIMSLSV